MFFYKVWVASPQYHKPEPLTYSSPTSLEIGEIVEVSLQKRNVHGFIKIQTSKPPFAAKEIVRSLKICLPQQQISLFEWLMTYYPAPSGQTAQLVMPKNPGSSKNQIDELPATHSPSPLPNLTDEQSKALASINKHVTGSILLHGNTGTGKTRVYLELARQALKKGRSVIVLTPEIGLTPQLTESFRREFGESVITSHSHLSGTIRRNIWLTLASSTGPRVVIGPRSALFLPVKNIGLIVVDEAHDNSYKQEQAPHYQATRVAAKLAQLHRCLSVFGTATPLVADYYSLQKNKVPIIRMTKPVHEAIKSPQIEIVDRTDKDQFKTSWLFCEQLITSIKEAKQSGLTSLIFLNRRGTARIMLCQNCAWQADCPNCDLPLTYHNDTHELRCHVCSLKQTPPLSCPVCQSTELSFHAAGTKALEQELAQLFPSYSLLRIDSDSTADDRLERQYENILSGKVDLIVGTQMITKGLDLPNLGVVGIPFADSSLYLPDFTADEQTYQVLTQVMGRVGRTKQATKVVIQTYQPKQPVILAAKNGDWSTFYNNQLEERRAFGYPPFTYLLQLTASRKQEKTLRQNGQKLVEYIAEQHPNVTVLGPSPRFHRKSRGDYQWQIIIKAPKRNLLLAIIKDLPAGWRYNLDPITLL